MKLLIALIFFLTLAAAAWQSAPAAARTCPSVGADPVCLALPQAAPARAAQDCGSWLAVLPCTPGSSAPLVTLPLAGLETAVITPLPLQADHWRPPRTLS